MRAVVIVVVAVALMLAVYEWREARGARDLASRTEESARTHVDEELKRLRVLVENNGIASNSGIGRAERELATFRETLKVSTDACDSAAHGMKEINDRLAERDKAMGELQQRFFLEQASAQRQLEMAKNSPAQIKALEVAMELDKANRAATNSSQPASNAGSPNRPAPVVHREGIFLFTFAYNLGGQRFQTCKESPSLQQAQAWADRECLVYKASVQSVLTIMEPK